MNGSIAGILFSKDRPLQARAAVESFLLHAQGAGDCALTVQYTASSPAHERLYRELTAEFPQARFLRESDFKQDLCASLERAALVLFMVDDNLFVRRFDLDAARRTLEARPRALGFSFRLGRNTFYSYPKRCIERMPKFKEAGPGCLEFNWSRSALSFGYPLDVSSSLYRTADLLPLLKKLPYRNPNQLEHYLFQARKKFKWGQPALLCYEHSVAFCNPLNKVQSVARNRAGGKPGCSIDRLREVYENGYRIEVSAYQGFSPVACHQEMPLVLSPRPRCAPAGVPPAETPRVTVFMPVCNQAACAAEAIESVLRQTFSDFELVVVDDGSTDNIAEVVQQRTDPRIRFIRHPQRLGLLETRNEGLRSARGEYLALLDGDDVALPQRLERQVNFMDSYPEAGVCGAAAEYFGECKTHTVSCPAEPARVKAEMLLRNPLARSSAMLRRQKVLEHGLSYARPDAEDYDLWVRASRKMEVACLAEVLVRRRVRGSELTRSGGERAMSAAREVRARQLAELGIAPTAEEFALHESLCGAEADASRGDVKAVRRWLDKLREANARAHIFPEPEFSRFLDETRRSFSRAVVKRRVRKTVERILHPGRDRQELQA